MKINKYIILLMLTFLIFIGLRVIHLEADPPINLGGSAGYFVDEGGWVFNARNKVLFGTWEIDSYNKMYLAPLMNLLYFISFSILGPSYISARLISIIFCLLIFVLLYLTLKESFGSKMALITLFLISINYLFIVYNRITHPRMGMMFFMALSLYVFNKAIKKNDYYFIPLGGSLFLGFVCQANMIYFIGATGISLLLCLKSLKIFKAAFFMFLGSLVIALPWYFLNYHPHLNDINLFSSIIRHRQFPPNISSALKNIVNEPGRKYFFHYMPFIWIAGCISFFITFFKTLFKNKNISPIEIMTANWLLCGLAFLAIMNDPALRWYVSIIPALIILTGLLIYRVTKLKLRIKPALIFLCILGVTFSLLYNAKPYLHWMSKPQYKVKQLSQHLGKTLPNAVICGLWSAELCLGNQHKAYISWKGLLNDDPDFLNRVGATHVFAVQYNKEDRYYHQYFPEEMSQAKLIGKYHLWRTDVFLYQLANYKDAIDQEPAVTEKES